MPVIKCKMCGGDLEILEGSTVCECTYCGTKQTVPSADNEKKLTLFARAGRLLRACEFDKASGVFETIVADFPEEAEAYWGLVLCKYGIEYVDDPATGKKIPTCHRSSFDSVMKDANFEQACENTDAVARRVYRDEARQIEELRKSIIEVSDKEEPYDVFISYKEKDSNGERTQDSVIAQEIYRELSREGYRVFFSRISLENRLGTEYEPYIFAALNSAKVMIVVGTDYENFNAVWVKNEWSRFLKLIAKGERKTLIPVFRNMDAYDMPEEFNKLTALDMGKVGAMQDLVHGVEKIVGKKKAYSVPAAQPVYVPQPSGPNVTAIMERGNMALEDRDWNKAKELFDQVLNMNPRCAEAYLGYAMAENKCENRDAFQKAFLARESSLPTNRFVKRALQFGDQELKKWLEDLETQNDKNNKNISEVRALSMRADGHFNRKEYAEALVLYKQAAESGYAHAQYEMGVFYQNGFGGLQKDYAQAMYWYNKAIQQNNPTAWNNIGNMYSQGLGVVQDKAKAFECYKKASDLKSVTAPFNVAVMYEQGIGTQKDRSKAAYYYQLAFDRGCKNAALYNNLGVCYMDGVGVKKDYNKAKELFTKAISLGSTEAKNNLALLNRHIRMNN